MGIEMIKLFLADDELYIRQGIRHSIDWPSIGIELIGDADNGQDALNRILLTQPDIVMCDIRMPKMDGLELSSIVRKSLPQTRIIMLTGYSNIEYLSEAIRMGIRDYLFKPAGSDQIYETITRIRDEIILDHQNRNRMITLENFYADHITEMKGNLLYDFLTGKISSHLLQQQSVNLDLKLTGPAYVLILFEVAPTAAWKIISKLQEIDQGNHCEIVHFSWCDQILILSNVSDSLPAGVLIHMFVDQLNLEFSSDYTLIHSDPMDKLDQLPAIYKEMNQVLPRLWWSEQSHVIRLSDQTNRPEIDMEFELMTICQIIAGLKNNDEPNNLKGQMEQYIRSLATKHPTEKEYQIITRQFLAQILNNQNELFKLTPELIEKIRPAPDVECMIEQMAECIGLNQKNTRRTKMINQAINYLNNHYQENVLLEDVAQEVFITKSHLCRILKEETGRGFKALLNQIRIEKAKIFLQQSGLYYYDIAQMVGFSSYKQFAKYFVHFTGLSAREYQLSLKQNQNTEARHR